MNSLPPWTEGEARVVAGELLGSLDVRDSCVCPGDHLHSASRGKRDCRVFFTGQVPQIHCFHNGCAGVIEEMNREFLRRLFRGKSGGDSARAEEWTAARPVAPQRVKRYPFDAAALQREQLPGLRVTREWLRERSPVDPHGLGPAEFLASLYQPGERVLCFLSQWSQGDYGFVKEGDGHRWVKLPATRDGKLELLAGPEPPRALLSGPEGVWYLVQPVDGKWHLEKDKPDKRTGLPTWSRRSASAVTAWRYLVLESDEAPTEQWLNFIVQFPMPIVALYTSGGRSVHALVRVDAVSKAEWDHVRDAVRPILSKLGADPAAMSAVRLSRLPGCDRRGKSKPEMITAPDGSKSSKMKYHRFEKPLRQELLWLNPRAAAGVPILKLPRLRGVGGTKENEGNEG